jgi:hypothetical protein
MSIQSNQHIMTTSITFTMLTRTSWKKIQLQLVKIFTIMSSMFLASCLPTQLPTISWSLSIHKLFVYMFGFFGLLVMLTINSTIKALDIMKADSQHVPYPLLSFDSVYCDGVAHTRLQPAELVSIFLLFAISYMSNHCARLSGCHLLLQIPEKHTKVLRSLTSSLPSCHLLMLCSPEGVFVVSLKDLQFQMIGSRSFCPTSREVR